MPTWQNGRPTPFGPGPGSLDDEGAAAEYLILGADTLVAAPVDLTDAEASTLQVAGVTAWNSLFGASPVRAGDRVLVIGAGGVSLYALQLARAVGAEVFVAARSGLDDPRWQQLGIDEVTNTTQAGCAERLATRAGGVDKVVNTVGAGMTNECLAALRGGGEVAIPGLYDMAPSALDMGALISGQASVRGVAVGSGEMHRQLSAFVEQHDLHPVIDRIVPFDDLPAALTGHRSTPTFGTVVITL